MITLKTLPQATAQQVYDQVKAHLLAQNRKSENEEKCLYRGPNGTKCAAGILIGDDEYKPEMDGRQCGWVSLVEQGIVPADHRFLIAELQNLHDDFSPDRWRIKLEELAVEYDLVP